MALLVGGEVEAAQRAYDWCPGTQRARRLLADEARGRRRRGRQRRDQHDAYLAVGVWHHWLVRRDEAFVDAAGPPCAAALDYVVSLQLPFGGIAWSKETRGRRRQRRGAARRAARASSTRCGPASRCPS